MKQKCDTGVVGIGEEGEGRRKSEVGKEESGREWKRAHLDCSWS